MQALCLDQFKEVFEKLSRVDLSELEKKPQIIVVQMNGCVTAISIDFQLKAMDSKLITILNQRTGSYCYCCTVSSAEAHNIETVSKGFYMEFGMDRLWETVEKLMADHNVPREEWDTFELPSVERRISWQPDRLQTKEGNKPNNWSLS